MIILKEEINGLLSDWVDSWNQHNLGRVLELIHDDIIFDNWTGIRIVGKDALLQFWLPWFKNHGGFRFLMEDAFFDQQDQKALFRWKLAWPSFEKKFKGEIENRSGVDILHFVDKKIIGKFSYSKTTIQINSRHIALKA